MLGRGAGCAVSTTPSTWSQNQNSFPQELWAQIATKKDHWQAQSADSTRFAYGQTQAQAQDSAGSSMARLSLKSLKNRTLPWLLQGTVRWSYAISHTGSSRCHQFTLLATSGVPSNFSKLSSLSCISFVHSIILSPLPILLTKKLVLRRLEAFCFISRLKRLEAYRLVRGLEAYRLTVIYADPSCYCNAISSNSR